MHSKCTTTKLIWILVRVTSSTDDIHKIIGDGPRHQINLERGKLKSYNPIRIIASKQRWKNNIRPDTLYDNEF